MSSSTWYSNLSTAWSSRRRSHPNSTSPTDIDPTSPAVIMAQNGATPIIISMNPNDPINAGGANKDKKMPETLFGPSIGAVSSGPSWTSVAEKKVLTDELTPDVIRGWIEKSKEPSHPTTTLQALVNLKRPTLRLTPLSSHHEDGHDDHLHHGLEFEYDCDAPKCGIYVHVMLPKDHPDAPPTSLANGLSKLLVFESVVDGGFGRVLKIEEGATLELGRFERIPKITSESSNNISPSPSGTLTAEPSSADSSALPSAALNASTESTPGHPASRNSRRRFTHFHFRKRSHHRSVTGPALAVMDAEPVPALDSNKSKEGKEEEDGIRVIIRLAALDEQGTELISPNEQLTYLHVVRFGTKSTPSEEASEEVEDVRPWVVKVVKREATIGPHTFHLHEIYGLSSSSTSSHNHAPTAPLPSTPTTYPPDSAPATRPQDDEPSSECLLCLSSPREVVLLPCRHLVACKECALNMVEFGAGGTIVHQQEEPASTDANGANGGEGTMDATTPAAPAPPPTRRKRRAKGWFCPVCRQPYTSLLRITANPPPPPTDEDAETDIAESNLVSLNNGTATPAVTEVRTNGSSLLSTGLRATFLRNLSFSRSGANQPDVEAQTTTTTSAANATRVAT